VWSIDEACLPAVSYPRHVEPLVQQCMEWCDSYPLPLVVPLTTWLPDPRPALVTTVTVGYDVESICPTVSYQHVFCAESWQHNISMYHVPSGKHIRTFAGRLREPLRLTENDRHEIDGPSVQA